eukprot:scaffold58355_cov66-Phaeocystis_antarctica.AAC.8
MAPQAALALFTFLLHLRSLGGNNLGPEGGMAIAEALKGNTTLKALWSAALQSNPLAHALRPNSMHAPCRLPVPPAFYCLRRVRSLTDNNLGPKGGMALAEALKGNATLETLESSALPSNPPAHALRPHSTHAHCTRPITYAVRAASAATTSAPRVAWLSPRRSRQLRPSQSSGLLPCHRIHPTMRQGPRQRFTLPCTSPPSSFLRIISTLPRQRL